MATRQTTQAIRTIEALIDLISRTADTEPARIPEVRAARKVLRERREVHRTEGTVVYGPTGAPVRLWVEVVAHGETARIALSDVDAALVRPGDTVRVRFVCADQFAHVE